MANTIQSQQTDLFTKHRENIAASLAHRLEVARAAHNTQLIAQLEREWRQLNLDSLHQRGFASFVDRLRQLGQRILAAIDHHSKLSVETIVDETGTVWWHAYDPATGKMLYAENESEVLQWIEEHNLGR